MNNRHWENLKNLILVAGHAVYTADNFVHPADDNNWYLQDFQKGEPPFYIEHIRYGVDLADQDRESLLVFSGGQTRFEAGPRSEAQSYWYIADHFNWWWKTNIKLRATTEEFARDSFENLLFGICRFKECTGQYPNKIIVVSWAFKKDRFAKHRRAIGFPEEKYTFVGVNNPVDLDGAERGERKANKAFEDDPYGIKETPEGTSEEEKKKLGLLGDKTKDRNPFSRQHPYETNCPELKELLAYRDTKEKPWWEILVTKK